MLANRTSSPYLELDGGGRIGYGGAMQKRDGNTGTMARAAGLVSVAVMCSRVLGLVREQVLAALFGAGFAYDAFVVAFRIPNLLRDLFAEGALSSAFVAVFSEYDVKRGPAETWQLASNVVVVLTLFLSGLTLVGIFFARPLVLLLAPDFAQVVNKVELTATLASIMMPFLPLISLASVAMGILNSKGRFFIPSLASAFFNVGSLLGGVSLALLLPKFGQPAIVGMAIGTLLGGLFQLAVQLPSLRHCGFLFRPRQAFRDPGVRRIFKLMGPAVIGLGATQINIFINTNFAASCVQGSVSWLNYAFRLVQFPIGVFGVALAIAAMPLMARCAAQKDMAGLKETYISALTMVFCLSIPATVGLYLLATPIIRVIYQHGSFSALDTLHTAEALALYAVGLFAYAAVKITVPVFYALNDTRFPVLGSFLAVGGNILMILLTIGPLQHRAIALATSVAMIVNFFFLSAILYRKVQGYSLARLGVGLGKVLLAAAAMGIWLKLVTAPLAGRLGAGVWGEIGVLLASILTGGAIYLGMLFKLRLPEMELLVEKVKRRFAK